MKTHADPTADCHKMKVSADELEKAVMTIIKKQAEVVLATDDFSAFRKTSIGERQAADMKSQIGILVEQRQQCYEQFLSHEIERDVFQTIKAGLTSQIDRLNDQLALSKQADNDRQAAQKMTAFAADVLDETVTPRDVVNALIEKVFVFPENRLEILWKFVDFAKNEKKEVV